MKIKTTINNLKNYKIYLQVEQAVNEFLQKKGYLKVDVPVLAPALIPESYLEIFQTEFRYFDKRQKLYLTPSPELFLKRLLVAGLGDCYYLGKAFRNSEPASDYHLPEYTMLECYRVGFTYLQLADEMLEMMKFIANSLRRHSGKRSASRIVVKNNDSGQVFRQVQDTEQSRSAGMTNVSYQNKKISFEKWEKYTVTEAFEKFAGIKEKVLFDNKLFIKKAKDKGYNVETSRRDVSTFQDIFSQIVSQEIEPNLGKNGFPSLLYDYPQEMSALAKLNKGGRTAKRIEFYIGGIEIGGCCEELNDLREQDLRFKREDKRRKKDKKISHPIDKGFIEALKYGLPDCTGAGIGLERLAMVFADVDAIDKLKLINII